MNARIRKFRATWLVPPLITGAAALLFPGLGPVPPLVALTVSLLGVGLFPEYISSLLFFTLCMLVKAGPVEEVFSGFTSSAFWLILAGMFLGQAVTKTGLGGRIAGSFARKMGTGWASQLLGVSALGVFMAFLMPSATGRVLLMLPIFQGLGTKLGHEEGSRAYTGLVLTGLLATFLPAMSILPANIANMVLIGAVESLNLPPVDYAHYLLLHFPVLGIVKTLLITALVGWMHRPGAEALTLAAGRRRALEGQGAVRPWADDEMRLAIVLALCLAFWCTDSLHGISPAWVGMVGALVCLMPGVGMLDNTRAFREVNMGSLFYVAAIISVGALVHSSGLGERIAAVMLQVLPLHEGANFANFSILGLVATVLGPVSTQPGIPAVMCPMATHLAAATGLSVQAVVMTQVLGFSTILFPFQTAPLLVGMRVMGLPLREGSRVVLILAALTIVLLWPLQFLFWRLIGYV